MAVLLVVLPVVFLAHLEDPGTQQPDDPEGQQHGNPTRTMSSPTQDQGSGGEGYGDKGKQPLGLVPEQHAQAQCRESCGEECTDGAVHSA